MPEPLKNLFNPSVYKRFTSVLKLYLPDFNEKRFMDLVFDENWENLELKERARHTTHILKNFLSDDFQEAISVLTRVIEHIRKDPELKPGIESMFVPDYIEVYGIEYPEISLDAMEQITRFFSCEFAIRPFIVRYPELSLDRMFQWSGDADPQVRRLSSEGCRPRLPWAMSIPFLKKDPTPILPILERLKNDEAETVRKSVANNLNDISKDNPNIVIDLVKKWKGHSARTDWIVKHASRTLLKQAHPEILEIFGFGNAEDIQIDDFKLRVPNVRFGDALEFSFSLTNRSEKTLLVRVEYGMYFLKANGKQNKKVFKISERSYEAGEKQQIVRKQSFKPISTRKYYGGPHKLSLIVNGKETEALDFELVMN